LYKKFKQQSYETCFDKEAARRHCVMAPEKEGGALFSMGYGDDFCGHPDVLMYVMTDYQILN